MNLGIIRVEDRPGALAAAVRGGKDKINNVVFHTDYAEVFVKPRGPGVACAA